MKKKKVQIETQTGIMNCIILSPDHRSGMMPGILWIHGGGYVLGMASMVGMSCGKMLGEKYGAVVLSPEYRLASQVPYPAAFNDCCAALDYMWDHASELGIDPDRIIVGGESAGGGLAAAVCLYARDQGRIPVKMQIPLYPMIDCDDTESSHNNHGKVWNTARNHWGWRHYLGSLYGSSDVPAYASAAKADSYCGMPPCFTFVSDGEPFYSETLKYVARLKEDGVKAEVDVYHGNMHAFDMLCPWLKRSRDAKRKLCQVYEEWIMEKQQERTDDPDP